jgi:hypothetical protein
VADENSYSLSEAASDAERRWEVCERECQEQFEELTLLQTRGSKLCYAIVGPPQMRNHLSEGMRLAALRHIEMVGELATLWAAVSSAAELALGRSPNEIFRVEVVGELVAEFQRLEEQRSWLERPVMRICDMLHGPPPSRARLADRLDEATGELRALLAAR